jgi:predicted O-methyltransferase YrrM
MFSEEFSHLTARQRARLEILLNSPRMYFGQRTQQNTTVGLLDLIKFSKLDASMTMLEVGSFAGVSSEMFALFCKQLVCVDQWMPYPEIAKPDLVFEAECRFDAMAFRNPNVIKFKMESGAAASMFADKTFDLIYIDAAHKFDAVDRDIKAWLPKLKPNGWLAGHDITITDVERAVYLNLHKYNDKGSNFHRFADTSWLIRIGDCVAHPPQ